MGQIVNAVNVYPGMLPSAYPVFVAYYTAGSGGKRGESMLYRTGADIIRVNYLPFMLSAKHRKDSKERGRCAQLYDYDTCLKTATNKGLARVLDFIEFYMHPDFVKIDHSIPEIPSSEVGEASPELLWLFNYVYEFGRLCQYQEFMEKERVIRAEINKALDKEVTE